MCEELERLPLENCFELHLSGCEIAGESFIDAHHGRLLEEQYALTSVLMPRCPNLRAITYEDPRFDEHGTMLESNRASWHRLKKLVADWESTTEVPASAPGKRPAPYAVPDFSWGTQVETALGDYLFGATPTLSIEGLPTQDESEAVNVVRSMVLERRYRGTGDLRAWYPKTIAAWHEEHPKDTELKELVTRFCASKSCTLWSEHPQARLGISLEEALYRFFEEADIGDAAEREDEMLGAVVRALAVTPRAGFLKPEQVRTTETGCIAVSRGLVLHAVTRGQYLRGPVTPLIATLLHGESVADAAARFGISAAEVELVHAQMQQRGLLFRVEK